LVVLVGRRVGKRRWGGQLVVRGGTVAALQGVEEQKGAGERRDARNELGKHMSGEVNPMAGVGQYSHNNDKDKCCE